MRAGTALALALMLPILLLVAGGGLAEAPATSIRPVLRPTVQVDPAADPATADPAPAEPTSADPARQPPEAAPKPRPAALTLPQGATPMVAAAPFPNGVIRPMPRPDGLILAAANNAIAAQPNSPAQNPKVSAKGSVCGDPAIKGQVINPVTSKVRGCGVAEPVKVTSVSGVVLNPAATLDCPTALALRSWIDQGLQPAFSPNDVVELRIFGSYICRSRNNVRGAKISEHGRGRAVDIGAFVLGSGKTVTVASNYNTQVRKAHKAACGIFGTTLGPGSDGYHEDHLHFDTATYRSGSYCR